MDNETIIGGGSDEANSGEQTPEEKAAAEDKASAEAKAAEEGKSPEEIKAAEEKAAEEGKSPEEIKAAEEKAAEEKAAEEKKEKEGGAPEEYTDFTMPEGMEVDKAMLEAFSPVAKELNLSQENAQKLVDLQAKGVKDSVDAHVKEWTDAMGRWKDDTKADKEIGGEHFGQTQSNVTLALKAFGTEKLEEILDVTGVGNHVELVRFFDKVGGLISNDKIDLGNTPSGDSRTQAEIMYPKQGDSA